LAGAFADAGLAAQVPVIGPLVGIFFGGSPVVDYEGSRQSAASGWYPPLFHGLLDRAVAVAPGAYEILFPSLAHRQADIDRTVDAAAETATAMVKAAGLVS
jgi:glutamate-1-semialdehyde 2,1-aminomutase